MAVLVFGSVNIDRTFSLPHWIEKGETLLSSSLSVQAGGKGANQAVALSKAGVNVSLASTIGTDGLWIKDILNSYGVDTSLINIKENIYTGTATILLDENGQNSIILYGGGNRENDRSYIDRVLSYYGKGDWIVLQNEINNLDYIIEKAEERMMKICFNPSPYEDKLSSLPLDRMELLVVNEIEMGQLTGRKIEDDLRSYMNELKKASQRFHSSSILLTLGEKGAIFKSHDSEDILYEDIVKTKAIDTTAAGDTFLGYFLSSLIKGRTYREALKRASKAASIAVSRKGAMDSIPRENEID